SGTDATPGGSGIAVLGDHVLVGTNAGLPNDPLAPFQDSEPAISNAMKRNVISGSIDPANPGYGRYGIAVESTSDIIQGNYIGTDVTGENPIPNGVGIFIENASFVQIGGTAEGTGNVISANFYNVQLVSHS